MNGSLLINDVIYAELSVRYRTKEALDAFLGGTGLRLEPILAATLFLADRVFQEYRKAGGSRTGVLPVFFIGAHAAVLEKPLRTRDTGRYRTY